VRVAPKRLPGEVPWVPSFNYDCSHGHFIQADAEVSQCPAFSCGEPCDGDLVRVGKGSRIRTEAMV
jgi:hypothetical protein